MAADLRPRLLGAETAVKPRLLLLLAGSMAASPAAWFAAQQGAGSLTYFACQAAAPPLGLAIGFLGLAACLAAGAISFQYRTAPTPFAAHLGLGLAGAEPAAGDHDLVLPGRGPAGTWAKRTGQRPSGPRPAADRTGDGHPRPGRRALALSRPVAVRARASPRRLAHCPAPRFLR